MIGYIRNCDLMYFSNLYIVLYKNWFVRKIPSPDVLIIPLIKKNITIPANPFLVVLI